MQQSTLAILKPSVASSKENIAAVLRILTRETPLKILASKTTWLDNATAAEFYQEHAGRFYFPRLVRHATSGPCHILYLRGEDAIQRWRTLIGPTHVYKDVWTAPESLRARFGISDTRNAFHGSDSPESAFREMRLFFTPEEVPGGVEDQGGRQ